MIDGTVLHNDLFGGEEMRPGVSFVHGRHGPFGWLVSAELRLEQILAQWPALVVGRFVAVIACDGGPLHLAEEEIRAGWTTEDGVAYGPRIEAPQVLPLGEYDEWYVFSQNTIVENPERFVNYGGFSIEPPHPTHLNAGWDRDMHEGQLEAVRELQSRFWSQIEAINPLSYLAEGDNLIVVTADGPLFTTIVSEL
jgi:hypothetical protein